MNPNDFLTENESIQESKKRALQERNDEIKHKNEISQVLNSISNVSSAISQAIANKSNIVSVSNLPTEISTPDIERVVVELKALRDKFLEKEPEDKKTHDLLNKLLTAIDKLPKLMPEMPSIEFPSEISINNQIDYKNAIQSVIDAVKAIEVNVQPNITVKPTDVKVQSDFKQLEAKFDILTKAVQAISIVIPEKDDTELLKRVSATTKAINSLSFPMPNYILPFKDSTGAAQQALVDSSGKLKVDVDMATEGIATETKQDDTLTKLADILAELVKKTEPGDIQNTELINAIRSLYQILATPPWYDPTTNTLKVGTHAVTVSSGTVTTVTNLTNFGTNAADVMARDTSINTWANVARRTIS